MFIKTNHDEWSSVENRYSPPQKSGVNHQTWRTDIVDVYVPL